jgi:hypothetical protein
MTAAEAIQYLSTKPAEMPVFVLLGSDKSAPEIVQRWIYLQAERLGWNAPKVTSAEAVVQAMGAWPVKKHAD